MDVLFWIVIGYMSLGLLFATVVFKNRYGEIQETFDTDFYESYGEFPPRILLPVAFTMFLVYITIAWGPEITYRFIKGKGKEDN